MKVLHLADIDSIRAPGGIESVINNFISTSLCGFEHRFVSASKIRTKRLLGQSWPSKKKVLSLLEENKNDFIHLHGSSFYIWMLIIILRRTKSKIVCTPFFHDPQATKRKLLAYINYLFLRAVISKDVIVHFCSTYERNFFPEVQENNYRLMPPLFITEAHQKTVKKESILFVGRDDNHKGFRLFVEVSKIFPDEAFIAVTQPKKITKFPKNLEIRSNISERELNDLYNRSKIFIFPSNYESFGGVFIEALSRGVIVIASNMILGTEFFEDNENIHKFKVTKDKQKCINAISERVKYIISNGVTFNDYANLHEQKNAISKKMHEQNYFSLLEVHQ